MAYVSTAPSGYFNIYIRSIQGVAWNGDEIAVSSDNNFGRSRLYFGDQDMHINPTWLPSGDELLLVSNRDVALGSGNVIRVPAVANGMARRQTVLAEQTLYRARPDVSIDGKRFVYSSTSGTADQFNNLYVQPTVGRRAVQDDVLSARRLPSPLVPGRRMDRVHLERGRATPARAPRDVWGCAPPDQHHRAPIQGADGHPPVTVRADGAPTGARVSLTAADGKFYAPTNAYARITQQSGVHMFHTTGSFTVELPPGSTDLTLMKGFELYPERRQVEIRAGEITAVDVTLRRMADLSGDGWHNGSTHVHTNYAGNLHNTLENMMMMSDGEDQDIVVELIANKDNRILDYQFFIPGGEAHPLSTPDRVLIVGEEYRPPFYGHVFMLGLEDHLISPFTTGYEGTGIESLYPSNTDMFRKAKAQGATTGYVHAFGGNADPLQGNLGGAKGFLVDAPLGTVDALEWSSAGTSSFYPVYALWNNDIKITAVGGEDAISSLHWTATLGAMRTYVRPDDGQRTMDGWLTGLRDGHAFVTNGPLVELTVNGRIAGETLALAAGTGTVSVSARVRSITPLTRAFIVHNGEEVAEVPLSENRQSGDYEGEVEITGSGWIHLRAVGAPEESYPLDARFAQAFTNPVWMNVGGAPIRDLASAEYGMQWIDKLTEMALAWPDWRSQTEIDHVLGQFQEARAVYERLAAEAGGM